MIEIFTIFLNFFFLFILFLFPLNFIKKNNLFFLNNFNFFDLICLNILFQFTIYLCLSFFYVKIDLIIRFIFIISLIFILFNTYKKNFIFKKNNLLIWSIALFSLIVLCNFFSIANNFKLQWDAIAHWFWKTQNFYQNGNLENLRNLPYSFYPHLGTLLWGNFWKLSYLDYEYTGRFFYSYIYLAAIFSIIYSIKSKYFFIISSALCYLIYDPYNLGGYQDFLVFYFITYSARLFFLLKFNKINNKIFFSFFLLIINLLVWSKQEGLIYSVILYLTYILSFKSEAKDKFLLLIYILIIFFLFFFLGSIFKNSSFFHEPIVNSFYKLKNIKIFIESFFLISLHLIKSLIQHPITMMSIVPLFYIIIFKKIKFIDINYIFIFFILNIILIFGIFFHSQFSLQSLLGPVMSRLILQTSGFYLLGFVYLFNINIKYEK